jgi:hypothetical protein
MSAWLVEGKTINIIATYLEDCREIANGKSFAKKLYDMNAGALKQRYPNSYIDMISDFQGFDPTRSSKPGVLKRIHCYLYQCSEGDVPNSPLFKLIKEIGERLKNSIIEELPDYKNEPWQ